MSDQDLNERPDRDEMEEGNERPLRKSKRRTKRQRSPEEMVEEIQPSALPANLHKMMKMFARHTKTIETKLEQLEAEVSRTSEAQRALKRKRRGSSKESTPTSPTTSMALEGEHKKIVYSITNMSSHKPKFGGHDDKDGKGREVHPVTFIEDLTSYLRKMSGQGQELDIVQECLSGEARNWSRIYKERWENYEDFKRDFLETFWGEVEQNKVRRDIVSNRWERKEHPKMLSHFLKLAGQVKLLTYKIPERQLVSDIMRHYPKQVQQLWALTRNESILAATDFLRQMDNIQGNNEDMNEEQKSCSKMNAPQGAKRENHDRPRQVARRDAERYHNWRRPEQAMQNSSTKRNSGGAAIPKAPGIVAAAALAPIEDGSNAVSENSQELVVQTRYN